jgi:hypothetical protein
MRRYGLHDDEWERIKDMLPVVFFRLKPLGELVVATAAQVLPSATESSA